MKEAADRHFVPMPIALAAAAFYDFLRHLSVPCAPADRIVPGIAAKGLD